MRCTSCWAHLETEDKNLISERDSDRLGDVEGKGRFPGRRAPRDDYKVRGLEPRGHQIKLLEARRHAGDVLLPLVEALDVLEGVLQDLADRQCAAFETSFGEAKDLPLGVVHQGLNVFLGFERLRNNLARSLDQLAEYSHVPNDRRIRTQVRGDRPLFDEKGQRCRSADDLELVAPA